MADHVDPADLPAGSTGLAPVRVTADGKLEVLDANGNTTATVDAVPVQPVAFAVTVGDVLMRQETGETLVVRWIADDVTFWSPAQSTRPQYTTDGWVKVGTATLA